jgi:perosamine synthetase
MERDLVDQVMRNGTLREGQLTKQFSEDFAKYSGAQYGSAVNSGTAALFLAYCAVFPKGSEVLVSNFTHVSTASMLVASGLKPKLVDTDEDTYLITCEAAEKSRSAATKGVVPVHLFGEPVQIRKISEFVSDYHLKVVYDAAQAHGALCDGTPVGFFGDASCYSFYPTKNMTTGEGGMVVTQDSGVFERIELLKNQGQSSKYWHTAIGYNFRMSEMQSALGRGQLQSLEEFNMKRRANAKKLSDAISKLEGLHPQEVPPNVFHVFHQYSLKVDLGRFKMDRDGIVAALEAENVSCGVHYPHALSQQPIFSQLPKTKLPNSEALSKMIFSIPVHPHLSEKELDWEIQALTKVVYAYYK